jgi:LruC domain-containing protein
VQHRGRAGVDVAVVKIGATLGSAGIQQTMTTGTAGWIQYTGTYTVPVGQLSTFFIFEAVSTASSISVGNFIDDVQITVISTPPCLDSDGDGVSDDSDDFPKDPERAVRNNYRGTLAYEDLWPSEGDYDFNDMVVEYNIGHILNSVNKLVEIDADWTVRAVGASFANGFGYQFNNIKGSAIRSITGQSLKENIVSVEGNGVEQGQNLATVIAFDNVFNLIRNAGGSFINTVPSAPVVPEETINNFISFNVPQVQVNVGLPPYNPFIFVNGKRSKEVHLKNYAPTDLADPSLFGTAKDASNPEAGITYTTEKGLPWAIHITGRFDYPVEYAPVNEAYLFFSNWAVSGGTQFEDWYLDLSGNRNDSKIY